MDSENPTNSVSVKVRVVFNQTLINCVSVVRKTVGRAQLQQTCITVRKRLRLHNIFTTSPDYVCGYVVIDLWYKVPPESVFCAKKKCLDKYIQPRLKAMSSAALRKFAVRTKIGLRGTHVLCQTSVVSNWSTIWQ